MLLDGLAVRDLVVVDVIEEARKDVDALLRREVLVLDGKVDTRLNGHVQRHDAVGGEDNDALVVLEDTQQDGYESVALEVARALALFQEHVGFVTTARN